MKHPLSCELPAHCNDRRHRRSGRDYDGAGERYCGELILGVKFSKKIDGRWKGQDREGDSVIILFTRWFLFGFVLIYFL